MPGKLGVIIVEPYLQDWVLEDVHAERPLREYVAGKHRVEILIIELNLIAVLELIVHFAQMRE